MSKNMPLGSLENTAVENQLFKCLAGIDSEFQKNELAYLALTTKIELPLRDRWAFALHRNLAGSKRIVSREWYRTDMAILDSSEPRVPRALIELKAMYTFDAVLKDTGVNDFVQKMADDEQKAEKLAKKLKSNEVPIYTVLLATHPLTVVPSDLNRVVKYSGNINRAIDECGGVDSVKAGAGRAIQKQFKEKNMNIIEHGCLDGGIAFGIPVKVLFWGVRAAHPKIN